MRPIQLLLAAALLAYGCKNDLPKTAQSPLADYLKDDSPGMKTGGVKQVLIDGKYKVWTKRVGNNPKIKLLLLHGGPGCTHEYFESFESFLPQEGIEFIYYDQLCSAYSDQPTDTSLYSLPRFVEEVEQVRRGLGLDSTNFYLLGHSWGGIVSMEYALKYQKNLKGLVISNMMSSAPKYGKYADEVLAKQMAPEVLKKIRAMEAKGDFSNPEYMGLLVPNFYEKHILRMPAADWPDAVNRTFARLNQSLYVAMQGPSEFGVGGKLVKWDESGELPKITVRTLVIGATHDTMDPDHMKWMAGQVKNGTFLLCPNGGHMCMWDDQAHYFPGLVKWLKG